MKSRRFLSVLIAVCMLLSSLATVAFAADGEFTCSNVSFGYVTDYIWEDATEFKAGKDLSAKISVSKTGDAQSVIFTLIVYSGDTIYDVNTVTNEVSAETTLTATASLPDNVDDCYVSAFLWDNYVDMNPICNISGFPDASVAVTGILVDGVAIPNFDPATKTYNVPVDGGRRFMPEVEVKTLDLGAKVTITDPVRFPGSSVIRVTNGAGDENTYTINYSFDGGFVSNIDYTENVYENIKEDMQVPSVYQNFQVGSKAFYDRAFLVTSVADESFLGMEYIGAGLGWKNSPPYRDYYAQKPAEWWKFTVDRDVTVKIVSQTALSELANIGFEASVITNLVVVDVNGTPYKYSNIYSKKYEKGDTVVLPAVLGTTGFIAFLDFEGYEEELVPGAELTGIEIESLPAKLEYMIGDELDLTGLVVKAVFSNSEKVEITDYEVSPEVLVAGNNTITISYEGFSTSFDVFVDQVTFGLSSLSVDGTPVDGFDIATKEYNVTIPANQSKFPVVEAVPTEGGAVTITDPVSFPGKATVTVSKDGEEDAVYTLNYITDKDMVTDLSILGDNKIPEIYGGGNAVALPEYTKGGFVVGAYAYNDRKDRTEGGTRYSVLEINDPSLVGADYITGGITWYNGTTPTVAAFSSADDLDWVQFTVNRDAKVYVLKHHSNDKQKFESRGYTQSISTNDKGYMYTLLNGTNHRYHKYMYSKEVAAGTKVTVPNSLDNNNTYHIIITYPTYEELEGMEPIIPDPELTGIEIASVPDKIIYNEGEELNLAGLLVKALYSDDSSEEISDYTVSHCDMSVGTHTITVTYEGFTDSFDITVEAIPEEDYGLTALTVDGNAVDGFVVNKFEYNVTIPSTQESFPVVEAVATDGATYEVTNPTSFPGSATVIVSKDGEDDLVYTLNYVTDKAMATDLSVLGDNMIPATYGGGTVSQVPEYYPGGFVVGAYSHADRKNRTEGGKRYTVLEINEPALVGADYIIGGITWFNGKTPSVSAFTSDDDLDWVQFTVNRNARVHVLKHSNEDADKLERYGYTESVSSNDNGYLYVLLNDPNHMYHKYMYTKEFKAGSKVIVPNATDKSNTYAIVVSYDNYEELEGQGPMIPEAAFGLASLSVDGEAVADFDIDTLSYEVTIPVNRKTVPVVDAIPTYDEATVEVVEPDIFPGEATVTVSMDGKEDVVYTITYVLDTDIVTNIEYNADEVASISNLKVPYMMTDLKAGNTAFYDRDGVNDSRLFPVEAVNDSSLVGKDYFGVGMWWNNTATYSNYYKIADTENSGQYLLIEDWWHFTLNRDATVTIITQGPGTAQAEQLVSDGWVKDSDTTNSKIDVNITSAGSIYNYKVKYTKSFAAGEVVTFPNIISQAYFAVIDYDGYTE